MSSLRRLSAAALVALTFAVPVTAQRQPAPTEGGAAVLDVTGAGSLDLGDLEMVLRPYRRDFDRSDGRIELTLEIDGSGAVIDCEAEDLPSLGEVGRALCDQAVSTARFEKLDYLELDFDRVTYRLTVRSLADRNGKGTGKYRVETGYHDIGAPARFGDYTIPPIEDRLSQEDLRVVPMSYPRSALSWALEARVIVALTFGADGRVAHCRPISSSNTARMAYETCRSAYRSYRLLNPPDSRPYAMATNWVLAD